MGGAQPGKRVLEPYNQRASAQCVSVTPPEVHLCRGPRRRRCAALGQHTLAGTLHMAGCCLLPAAVGTST